MVSRPTATATSVPDSVTETGVHLVSQGTCGDNQICYSVSIDCNGLVPREAEIRVSHLSESKGAVVFASGGFGTRFYDGPIVENMRDEGYEPELPISNRLGPSNAPSSTRAILVLLMNAVNHPIERTKPSVGVVNWRSMGSGGGFHHVCTPFQSPGTHLALGCLSSPLMTSRIIATLVLDGARRYAPTLAGIPPGTLPPEQAETPTSWHAAPDVHPS